MNHDAIGNAVRTYVDAGTLAGAATLAWRGGRVVHCSTTGRRELETGLPVDRDTIFRIASMTKPITTLAALMLLEDGRLAFDTPITRDAPELARLSVLRDAEGSLEDTVDAQRPITYGDLLTHRSGLTYGEFHHGPVRRACAEALGGQIDNPLSPDEWIERLATLPLIDQPGAEFHYGLSTDLLGFLLARIEARHWAYCSRSGFSPHWGWSTRDFPLRRRSAPAARGCVASMMPASSRHWRRPPVVTH